ncbi:MAG: alpha/beta hydrolase [Deltaproteobacteria bacterium]|nr:alpha/beta hydrolase [Deltaproteobacteria bacterium]
MNLRPSPTLAAFVLAMIGILAAGTFAPTTARAEEPLPIVYVHGGAGSGAQYETQAMRFASNGYPNVVRAIDRTSSSSATLNPMLDAFFDAVMAETGDTQIYVVAHSLGTSLMINYLNSSAARSARVAKYINIDGATGANCPGNPAPVNCIGVWGQGNPARIMGANNVYFPDFGHTQTVTAPESFAAQYKYLTGEDPATTLVLPVPAGEVQIAGKLINFPANTGLDGATVHLYEVHDATGVRKDVLPVAMFDIGPTGEWGPVAVNGKKYYEFHLMRSDVDYEGHYYFQPFLRSNYLVRLLASPVGSAIVANTASGPDQSAAVLIRYKEWWADQGAGSDIMNVSITSPTWGNQGPLNILSNPAVGVRAASKIGLHVMDNGSDKVSTLAPVPYFVGQIFQTGVDIWMPATTPPDGSIRWANAPRGDTSRVQTVNTPNWASDYHRLSIQFNDYVQDVNSWVQCKQTKPSPCK